MSYKNKKDGKSAIALFDCWLSRQHFTRQNIFCYIFLIKKFILFKLWKTSFNSLNRAVL